MNGAAGVPAGLAGYLGGLGLPRRSLPGVLPLVHTTNCERFAQIVAAPPSAHALKAVLCNVFGVALVYLFYGRPAYRPPGGWQPNTAVELCPVCLVFKPSPAFARGWFARLFKRRSTAQLEDVYSFDTGAAHLGMFPGIPNPVPNFAGYGVGTVLDGARQVVWGFFETNRQYFLGEPRTQPAPAHPEAAGYHALITGVGPAAYDDRRSAIEVRVSEPLPLRKNLLAVVLPAVMLERPEVRRAVRVWGCRVVTYPTVRGSEPRAYAHVVRDLVYRLYERKGYL